MLVTGSDEQSGRIAEALKDLMLALHSPPENARRLRRSSVVETRRRAVSVLVAVRHGMKVMLSTRTGEKRAMELNEGERP